MEERRVLSEARSKRLACCHLQLSSNKVKQSSISDFASDEKIFTVDVQVKQILSRHTCFRQAETSQKKFA